MTTRILLILFFFIYSFSLQSAEAEQQINTSILFSDEKAAKVPWRKLMLYPRLIQTYAKKINETAEILYYREGGETSDQLSCSDAGEVTINHIADWHGKRAAPIIHAACVQRFRQDLLDKVFISPDGQYRALVLDRVSGRTIIIFKKNTLMQQLLGNFKCLSRCFFSSDNNMLAIISSIDTDVKIFKFNDEARKYDLYRTIPSSGGTIDNFYFLPENFVIITGDDHIDWYAYDGTHLRHAELNPAEEGASIASVDFSNREFFSVTEESKNGDETTQIFKMIPEGAKAQGLYRTRFQPTLHRTRVTFSPHYPIFALSSRTGSNIYLFQLGGTYKRLATLTCGIVHALTFSPDGDSLYASINHENSREFQSRGDGTIIKKWNLDMDSYDRGPLPVAAAAEVPDHAMAIEQVPTELHESTQPDAKKLHVDSSDDDDYAGACTIQ